MKRRIYAPSLKSFLKWTAINNSPVKDKIEQDLHAHVGSLPSVASKGKFCLLVLLLLFSVLQRLLQFWCCIIIFLSSPNSALSLLLSILARLSPHSPLPRRAVSFLEEFLHSSQNTLFIKDTFRGGRHSSDQIKGSGAIRQPGNPWWL